MQTVIGILLITSVYILIYYRLLVRHYYEKAAQKKESTFGAVFSFPPYRILPPEGRKYAKRYWITLFIMIACISAAATQMNFTYLPAGGQ